MKFQKLINILFKNGLKNKFENLVRMSFFNLEKLLKLQILTKIINIFEFIAPITNLKKYKKRGKIILIPKNVTEKNRYKQTYKWLVFDLKCSKTSKKNVLFLLNQKVSELLFNKGELFKKRNTLHKLILENIGFINSK